MEQLREGLVKQLSRLALHSSATRSCEERLRGLVKQLRVLKSQQQQQQQLPHHASSGRAVV